MAADPAALDEVERLAKVIEASAVDVFARRQAIEDAQAAALAAQKPGDKPPARPALDKYTAQLIKELVDDKNAPLFLPKGQVDKLLPAERKEFLAAMQKEIESLKKSADAKYPIAHSMKEGGRPISRFTSAATRPNWATKRRGSSWPCCHPMEPANRLHKAAAGLN